MKIRMNESGWAVSNDSYTMLRLCRRVIRDNPRKGRLFAVACCERIRHLLADPRSVKAVEVSARYAEGLASGEQLQEAERLASTAHADAFEVKGKVGACPEWAAQFAASADAWFAASRASNYAYVAAGDSHEGGPEHSAQAHLLRCIFGPLAFRSVGIEPACLVWESGMLVKLAKSIHDERAFERMPILADALEDACCQDAVILAHCRQSGEHVRGCWVVDCLLEKG